MEQDNPADPPPALLNRPFPAEWETSYWEAFNRLSSSRQWTMGGPAAIPMSEMLAYFNMYGIDDATERDEYLFVLQELDAEYLDHASKKVK